MKKLEKILEKYYDKMGFSHCTRNSYTNNIRIFLKWCELESINPKKVTLDQIYLYVSQIRERKLSNHTVRERITTAGHYFNAIGRKDNPVLFIRTGKKEITIPKNLLDEETLIDLYLSITPQTLRDRRNKVILGLLIFQGITKQEAGLIEVEHVEFDKNRVYIPASSKMNARYLPLRQIQRPDLEDYVYKLRGQLLIEAGKTTERMFFSQGNSNNVGNLLWMMARDLKMARPQFKSFSQLRESRISIWLNHKKEDLRMVQYLSGMRYASSLLRHKRTDTEQLKRKLDLIHPMDRF